MTDNFIIHEEDGVTYELVDGLTMAVDMYPKVWQHKETGMITDVPQEAEMDENWELIYKKGYGERSEKLYTELNMFIVMNEGGDRPRQFVEPIAKEQIEGEKVMFRGQAMSYWKWIVAKKDGKLIGTLRFNDAGLLDRMAVDSEYRKRSKSAEQGNGRNVSENLMRLAVPMIYLCECDDFKEVLTYSATREGAGFDQRMGFQEIGDVRQMGFAKVVGRKLDPKIDGAIKTVRRLHGLGEGSRFPRNEAFTQFVDELHKLKDTSDPLFDEVIREHERSKTREAKLR